ncbi:MAG: ABC transporter ATP-binding protein [Pseudomonadota bacterium]
MLNAVRRDLLSDSNNLTAGVDQSDRQFASDDHPRPAICDWKILELEGVGFSYNPSTPTIESIALNIDRGSLVGFVGPSGSGKTTTIDVIMGLLPPENGSLEFVTPDGRPTDVGDRTQMFAYVPQESAILDASIAENIAFGIPSELIDSERVDAAIRDAGLLHVVERLPDGPDTLLGESGKGLSVGERQRVGIARALYRDAPIIVLDEPTAAQDAENEADIMSVIEGLRGSKTVIAIAHRVNSLKKFDKIFLFESGRIVNEGSFSHLMSTEPRFSKLVEHFAGTDTEPPPLTEPSSGATTLQSPGGSAP